MDKKLTNNTLKVVDSDNINTFSDVRWHYTKLLSLQDCILGTVIATVLAAKTEYDITAGFVAKVYPVFWEENVYCFLSRNIQSRELPPKIFVDRKSVLTELFENNHFLTVYHLFIILFLSMSTHYLLHDYLYHGEVRLGFAVIFKGFRNMHLMALAWLWMFVLSLIPYYGIKHWMEIRNKLERKSLQIYLWDRACMMLYVLHLLGMLCCGTVVLIKSNMGFAAGLSSILETMRLVMKAYAFGRVCVFRVLNQPEKYSNHHPSFSQYIYFSFAPTLVYRDSYPRMPGNVRWGHIAIYLAEFIAGIFLWSVMFDEVFRSYLSVYGLKQLSLKDVLMFMIKTAPFGLLTLFMANYILLHLWLNAFAEILRFSDRLFYKDWWTSTSYERYYRTWNTVVHDWLFTYVYKDLFEIVVPKKKMLGKVAVFLLSSIFHDYAVSLAIGFFIPVYFVFFFVCGVAVANLKFPNNLIGNVFLLYTVGLGASMMLTVYSLEYYARLNCIKGNLTTRDYFIPKMLECYK